MSGPLKFPMTSDDFNSTIIETNVKEEGSSKGDEFIPHIHSSSIYHLVPELEIKQEEVNLHNSTSKSNSSPEAYCAPEFDTASNISRVDCSSKKTEEKDWNDTYLDLLQCQLDCETCQTYLNLLSEHVRSTHCPSQPTQDPLHIDPLDTALDPQTQKSSCIQIKTEILTENIDSSQEDLKLNSESDPDFESQSESESDTDPDYTASHQLTQKVRRQGSCSAKKNASSDSKNSKAKKGIVSSRQQFKCNECDKGFSTKGNLSKHRRIHTEERPQLKCNECEKTFTTKSNLIEHKKSHTGEKPYQCDACEKSFTRLSTLKEHQRIHTGEKRFECDECEKSFVTSSQLNEHKRVHTGEKPYDCTVCKKSFRTLSALKGHVRMHTGERLHKCNECEKSFARTDHLTKHMRSHRAWKMDHV